MKIKKKSIHESSTNQYLEHEFYEIKQYMYDTQRELLHLSRKVDRQERRIKKLEERT